MMTLGQTSYLKELALECAGENQFAQDAIEHGLLNGTVTITFDPFSDIPRISAKYDELVENYHQHLAMQKTANPPEPKFWGTEHEIAFWVLCFVLFASIIWCVCFAQ